MILTLSRYFARVLLGQEISSWGTATGAARRRRRTGPDQRRGPGDAAGMRTTRRSVPCRAFAPLPRSPRTVERLRGATMDTGSGANGETPRRGWSGPLSRCFERWGWHTSRAECGLLGFSGCCCGRIYAPRLGRKGSRGGRSRLMRNSFGQSRPAREGANTTPLWRSWLGRLSTGSSSCNC